jgi:hypothetical protein
MNSNSMTQIDSHKSLHEHSLGIHQFYPYIAKLEQFFTHSSKRTEVEMA